MIVQSIPMDPVHELLETLKRLKGSSPEGKKWMPAQVLQLINK